MYGFWVWIIIINFFFVRNTLEKNREKTERRRKTEKKNSFDQQDSLVGWWLICGIIELIFWYCVFDTRFYNLIGGDFIWRYLQSNIVSNWIESFLNFFLQYCCHLLLIIILKRYIFFYASSYCGKLVVPIVDYSGDFDFGMWFFTLRGFFPR